MQSLILSLAQKLTRKRSISQSPIRESRGRKRRDSFIEISSDESIEDQHYNYKDSKGKNHCSDYKKSSKERSRSRFSESPYSRHLDYRSKEKYDHHLMRYRNSERSPTPNSAEIEEDGPVNLVSVCRLLSALETELGLLAKPVIDLLKKGVALEKSKPNSADELLFNTENSNILETVKEKLKGVLTANLLASNKIVAVKRAIQNIATLLHDVNSKKKHENENKTSLNEENSDPVALAKLEIAKVITQSLLDQGRSDFPPEELEALVESFIESTKNDEQQKANKIENVKTKDSIETLKTPLVVTTDTKKSSENSTGLENLTDEDLQTLLRNFADLTSDEQTHLIAYLSKIEQSNPARVEKLRKFVNIGDVDEYNDFEENVTKMKSDRELDTSFNETSMELVKNDLSDDDYDDEIMAKHLGSSDDLNKKPSMSSSAVSSNAFKDNLGLADSLMSSLIQSSMPLSMNNELELQGNEWGGACVSGASAYYQQPQLKNYQNLMSRNFSVYPNVLIPQNEMSIQVITPQMESSWPQQSSVSNFTYEQNHSHDYPNKNNRDNVQYRKKFENHNNHQLTGKKSRR
ncbi:CLUMA_CG020923, isoform A [Clunio marinus]|uniref:CLUMA_CG020923, isoform A n=1 Tax=Clunio marinus TaxID=568069 RepID=A0A1J1J6P0_9DIPT|nr:CLUMA_CG020923, isoform A [Clunio marinus]